MSQMTVEEACDLLTKYNVYMRYTAKKHGDTLLGREYAKHTTAIETILAHVDQQASEIAAKDAEIARLQARLDRQQGVTYVTNPQDKPQCIWIAGKRIAIVAEVLRGKIKDAWLRIEETPVVQVAAAGLDQTGGENAET